MANSMTKAELVSRAAESAQVTKALAEKILSGFVTGIESGLSEGKSITLVGFGSFSVEQRKEREGRNPQTGKKMTIPASNYVRFKAGKALKNSVK